MKNFVKHILAIAICAAALLSSCIKEEAYVTQDVLIDVTLTRAGTTSAQQGDQIQDIMLWAFELSTQGIIQNDGKPIGWRQFTPPSETYTSINLHLPVKKCGVSGAKYRLIAVLNCSTFTDANGNKIDFGPNTTYEELTTGKFVSEAVMNSAIKENNPGTPAVMPITHWADVKVQPTDVHATACAEVNIPVFRTVAKTQFFMACKANQLFDVTIKKLTLHCGAMPTEGVILSKLAPADLNSQFTAPDWFGTTTPNVGAAANYNLYTAPTAEGATQKKLTMYHENRPDIADNETADYYDLIGSHFIYETENASTTGLAVKGTDNKPTTDKGYYYEIVYETGGLEHTYYTGIPYSILRNHDYQVRALVEGGSGELSFEVVVNEWAVEEEVINYTNIVTVTEGGHMKWTQLPDERQVPDGYTQNPEGYILDSEGKNVGVVPDPVTTDSVGVINMTENGDAYATCTFALSTPVGGTWYAVLETVSGDVDAFEIVEADSGAADEVVAEGLKTTHTGNSASGPISPVKNVTTGETETGLVTLKFRTKADNETLTPNQAVLKITAKGFWGGKERVYEVVNITGLGKDINYSLRQPVKAL